MTLSEEDYNNQVARIIHSVDNNQHFSPATHIISQQVHVHGSRNSDSAYAYQHELPLTKADLALFIAECPICLQKTPTRSS